MQNSSQDSVTENQRVIKVIDHKIRRLSTPHSTTNSSPNKSETETFSEGHRFASDSSDSDDDSVSEVESFMIDQEFEEDTQVVAAKFLLNSDEKRAVDPETQARLEALLQAAGISQFAVEDGKHLADPEVLRRLTSSVSCALDEAAAALTRMRSDNPHIQPEKTSLIEACTDGDVGTVRKLLTEGRSVHETSEEGESLLSLACSAGYYELAQVLLAMHANVEDRGIKGECTPLMEAASAGHLEIVKLLITHGADVNAQSTSGNTPLMYGCAGGHTEVVKYLLENGANVEDHNENGHTPLMEAASAGYVNLAKILLNHGAGINTHSNEFKESALTLACYKGHLDMVRFLLEAGADQEHKTDEMHTALMEASMDGHVEVARLLLDSGAQVNMPTDSFESPLTLAACGGHVDLAMLLIERGANIEEVNDEGYTPLMEAAREGHEEMVHLLLGQGANINAQTDETQETALTLACCGGFTEVADILLKGGADIELGASTPLMEAAQEGHLELVKFLLECGANVHAQTQTGDTALTYACENGHTDVADCLLAYGADLEHESEGGRTPLMKACRAGHLCTVQFLISKGSNVKKQTTNNDHTPLSLACAGGHLPVVELLLSNHADPHHKLKDNSTMIIEAAKGGHTHVVQLLLDYPHSVQPLLLNQQQQSGANLCMLPGQIGNRDAHLQSGAIPANLQPHPINFFEPSSPGMLHEVTDTARLLQSDEPINVAHTAKIAEDADTSATNKTTEVQANKTNNRKVLAKSHSTGTVFEGNQQHVGNDIQNALTQPLPLSDFEEDAMEIISKDGPEIPDISLIKTLIKSRKNIFPMPYDDSQQKQQILEELHRVEREFHGKQASRPNIFPHPISPKQCPSNSIPHMLNINIAGQQQAGNSEVQPPLKMPSQNPDNNTTTYSTVGCITDESHPTSFYFTPLTSSPNATTATLSNTTQCAKLQNISADTGTTQSTTVISDKSIAKASTKKDGTKVKQQKVQIQSPPNNSNAVEGQARAFNSSEIVQLPRLKPQCQFTMNDKENLSESITLQDLNVQGLDLDSIDQESLMLKEDPSENLLTASILQQFHNSSLRAAFIGSSQQLPPQKNKLDAYNATSESNGNKITLTEKDFLINGNDIESIDTLTAAENIDNANIQIQAFPNQMSDSIMVPLATQQDINCQSTELSRVEYFTVPGNNSQMPVHALYPYDYLTTTGMPNTEQRGAIFQAGFQAGITMMQQQIACPNTNTTETLTNANAVPSTVMSLTTGNATQPYLTSQQVSSCAPGVQSPCSHIINAPPLQINHHCAQQPCTQLTQTHQQIVTTHQVQAATQTPQANVVPQEANKKSSGKHTVEAPKSKKGRVVIKQQNQNMQNNNFQPNLNYQVDHTTAINHYSNGTAPSNVPNNVIPVPCLDVDSETESNHDTALTLACAGGHEDLVELLLSRGADIEHRDKKGFTPLILAATAGHEKVVDILLNHSADIEAQSERTKDTPLSLACSGGRYEVVELLLSRSSNKEHRNVSDYTPLSLAASGGYVNIIKLLLSHGAEINSRTGSKLGISPLMLAAMNGHTSAVKLLLDMGSDINAQIETNRNTALTLACFQGRHEVVSLLLDRKANVEHRAKTGLTPLMEAASGGYVEVGRVLLDKGADVNAAPVPSSRDTALTIAADKGHVRFVELLLCRGAQIEVKNKKGNSPLWLAANGGHLAVVELLYNSNADIDSQDNRKVSCLMAAFRKGHLKVVKWMVLHVTQFPSDQEMIRYIATINDKDLLEKSQECVKIIRAAKETQAAKANKNATILLEELDMEKNREETKRLAAARRRERKKKKKLEKKEEKRKLHEETERTDDNFDKNKNDDGEDLMPDEDNTNEVNMDCGIPNPDGGDKEEGDSGIDANSQGSCSSGDIKTNDKKKDKKKKKPNATTKNSVSTISSAGCSTNKVQESEPDTEKQTTVKTPDSKSRSANIRKSTAFDVNKSPAERDDFEATGSEMYVSTKTKKATSVNFDLDTITLPSKSTSASPKQSSKRDEGWKEVVRKSSVQTVGAVDTGVKKVSVPLNAISRVIGRGGSNINAIRGATGAHIEVEKQSKGQGERIITIKGSSEATKQAHNLIATLIKDPDVDILQMLPKAPKSVSSSTTLWDKTQLGTKKVAGKAIANNQQSSSTVQQKAITSTSNPVSISSNRTTSTNATKTRPTTATTTSTSRSTTIPKLSSTYFEKPPINTSQPPATVKPSALMPSSLPSAPSTSMTSSPNTPSSSVAAPTRITSKSIAPPTLTFAAKLSESTVNQLTVAVSNCTISTGKMNRTIGAPPFTTCPKSPNLTTTTSIHSIVNTQSSPKHTRPIPTSSAPPAIQHYQSPGKGPLFSVTTATPNPPNLSIPISESVTGITNPVVRSTTPNTIQATTIMTNPDDLNPIGTQTPSEYSLFYSTDQPMWKRKSENQKPINFAAVTGGSSTSQSAVTPNFIDNEPPPIVDVAKAPGYRGGTVCSPISSKTSTSSATPPTLSCNTFQLYAAEPSKPPLPPIGRLPTISQTNPGNLTGTTPNTSQYYSEIFNTSSNPPPNKVQQHNGNSLNNNDGHFNLQPTFNTNNSNNLQNMNFAPATQNNNNIAPLVSMSRLNPKAPDFASTVYNAMSTKQPPQIYNGYPLSNPNTNTIYSASKTGNASNTFRTANVNNNSTSAQNRWTLMQMQQQQQQQQQQSFNQHQNELLSGMGAGLTLHSLSRVTGGEIFDNNVDLNLVSHSPTVSPNLPIGHNFHANDNPYIEDRKQPQPIGTERGRKVFNHPNLETNWGFGNDTKESNTRWSASTSNRFGMSRVYTEDLPTNLDAMQNMPLDTNHSFQNGSTMPHYMLQQNQGGVNNVRPYDYMPTDPVKLDFSWDASRSNLTDLQDKSHNWTGNISNHKWNQ